MALFSVTIFFAVMWGLGFTLLAKLKEPKEALERNVIRVAIGISVFILLGVILNFVGIPIDWKIFTLIALVYPLIALFKFMSKNTDFEFKLKKKIIIQIFLLLIIISSMLIYIGGAFKYVHLEDDDPWSHAESAKYVSIEKTLDTSVGFHYLNPYPPGFAIIMGVMHQTNDSINWSLKFFNGLLLSLSVLFFYYFAKEFVGSEKVALFATFLLAAIPSYFTHFIWAHSLVIMLMFPTLYCFEKLKESKRWMLPAMISVSGILLSQPSQALKIAVIFAIYSLVTFFHNKKIGMRIATSGILGVGLSFFWWGSRLSKMLGSTLVPDVTDQNVANQVMSQVQNPSIWAKIKAAFPASSGTATRSYTLHDFVFANKFGGINVHVGWGIAVSVLVLLGLIYILTKYKSLLKKENSWMLITLLWFIFTFLGVNAMTFNLPIGFITFRFWLLLAIPAALLGALGLELLFKFFKGRDAKAILVGIVVIAVILTSLYPKYYQNTQTVWPPGVTWTSMEEIQGFTWLLTLKPDTKVFEPTPERAASLIGFDKFMCRWCSDEQELFADITSKSPDYIHNWLSEHDYEYIILSASTESRLINKFGKDKSDNFLVPLLQSIAKQDMFSITYQNKAVVVAKVI